MLGNQSGVKLTPSNERFSEARLSRALGVAAATNGLETPPLSRGDARRGRESGLVGGGANWGLMEMERAFHAELKGRGMETDGRERSRGGY